MDTRRPRLVTTRLVVVALLVGLLPAVAVGPVVVGLTGHRIEQGMPELAAYAFIDGHALVAMRYDSPLGTVWNSGSEPEDELMPFVMAVTQRGATEQASDPRPRIIRTELDGERRGGTWWRLGWPFEATHALSRTAPSGSGQQEVGVWRPTIRGRQWSVPYLPLWPGLLANAAFYTALVLAPLVLLRGWRLRRRVKRGRCVACGYELGEGVHTCPECGLAKKEGTEQ